MPGKLPAAHATALWLLCEVAIAACDLAEVIGTIVALKLLFNLPYLWGLAVAGADTFLLLALQKRGVRLLEVVTLALIGVIAVSFFVEIVLARPDWGAVVHGFLPGLDPIRRDESLYVAIGMLGATVMPHNLYLHSALVQTRAFDQTPAGKRLALKYNLIDSLVALNGAFLVNVAILILAAAKFAGQEELTLQAAYHLLPAKLGTAVAAALFAIALLASGQSSTFTGTLAGQVVMEGFVRFRLRPWARRLLTRAVAIVPALVVVALAAPEPATPPPEPPEAVAPATAEAGPAAQETPLEKTASPADRRLLDLLVLSQVVLSFQLPFAIVPLVHFTSERRRMGEFASRGWLKGLAWACGIVVIGLNAVLIYQYMGEWAGGVETAGCERALDLRDDRAAGGGPGGVPGLGDGLPRAAAPGGAGGRAAGAAARPGPLRQNRRRRGTCRRRRRPVGPGGGPGPVAPRRPDRRSRGRGTGAQLYGSAVDDQESRDDRRRMAELVEHLRRQGLPAEGVLGYGVPPEELTRIARERGFDLLVMGTHGHRLLADMALGQTVAPILHRLTIPILVVPTRPRSR